MISAVDRLAVGLLDEAGPHRLADEVERGQALTGEHDALGSEQVDHRGDADAERVAGGAEDRFAARSSRRPTRRPSPGRRRTCRRPRRRHGGSRTWPRSCQGSRRPAVAAPVARDREVAELAGYAVRAGQHLALVRQSTPDAGADRDHRERGASGACAEPAFARGQRPDVVLDGHRQPEPGMHVRRETHAVPAEEVGVGHQPGGVHAAGDPDADPTQPLAVPPGSAHSSSVMSTIVSTTASTSRDARARGARRRVWPARSTSTPSTSEPVTLSPTTYAASPTDLQPAGGAPQAAVQSRARPRARSRRRASGVTTLVTPAVVRPVRRESSALDMGPWVTRADDHGDGPGAGRRQPAGVPAPHGHTVLAGVSPSWSQGSGRRRTASAARRTRSGRAVPPTPSRPTAGCSR